MLLVVLLLVDDDVAVDEEVVEEEELSWLELLPARLGEDALSDEDAPGDGERLPGRPEAALHHGDAAGVGLAVH